MGWGIGNLGGGSGGGLNFKVVGNPQPASPKENTIWVNTDAPITSWIFSATEPEIPADGDDGLVWFHIGTTSPVSFNALKKNTLQVSPISAKQWIGGEFIEKTAKSYQDGEWVDWWDGHLYFAGKEYPEITGGWIGEALAYSSGFPTKGEPVITRNEDNIVVQSSGQNMGGIIRTKNKVDITSLKKITADIFASNNRYCSICFWTEIGNYHTDNLAQEIMITNTARNTIESALTLADGEYYIGLAVLDNRSITMYSMKLS